MSSKSKEIIMKSLIVIGMVSLSLVAFIYPVTSFFIDFTNYEFIIYPTMIVFFISGFLLLFLIPFFGQSLKQKPVKAEKFVVSFSNDEQLLTQLENTLKHKGYKEYNREDVVSNLDCSLYYCKRYWTLICVSIVKVDVLSHEVVTDINRLYKQLVEEIYGSWENDRVSGHISLFLIENENVQSSKLVNSNITQRYQRFYLPAYILNSSGVFYVAKQKDGFGTSKYRQLRKELLNIMRSADMKSDL